LIYNIHFYVYAHFLGSIIFSFSIAKSLKLIKFFILLKFSKLFTILIFLLNCSIFSTPITILSISFIALIKASAISSLEILNFKEISFNFSSCFFILLNYFQIFVVEMALHVGFLIMKPLTF